MIQLQVEKPKGFFRQSCRSSNPNLLYFYDNDCCVLSFSNQRFILPNRSDYCSPR
ncbi:unnamed protein product [Amoebophrya sp. A120]|nr:unnamed protein product [Amoebophrya sp. A120]|eukprot:GSA120T00010224001.1